MQPGPSGPPVAPTGPPSPAKPLGPPKGRPSKPPKGRPARGPPSDEMDQGAFDELAAQNEARQKELDRREKSVELKKLRNGKRINVVLMLLLVVIFGVAALWPITYGDISVNPHQFASESEIINRNDAGHPAAWDAEDLALMNSKIWDGSGPFSGSVQYDLTLPGIPLAVEGVTTIPVTVKLISYRQDGADTGFRLGFFEGSCDNLQGLSIEHLPENLRFGSVESMLIGKEVEVEFQIPAGNYCVVFEYISPPVEQGLKATVDAEITTHWTQPLLAPVAIIFGLMSLFAVIGAHKAGKAWKAVAQPEKPARKTTEDEVLDEADEQRGVMSETSEEPIVESPEAGVEPDPAAEFTAEPEPEAEEPAEEPTAEEPAAEEPEYTDEQLRGFGWSEEQIQWHRQSQTQQQEPDTQEYTDEQLAAAGWSPEQIAAHRAEQ